jgi:hypothetical protein
MTAANYALTIVKPLNVTTAMLVSTDVPETDHAAWAVGTTYALGARVILTSTHKIYESLQAANVGKDPTSQPTWWIEVSPTNRWKAFDTSNSTQTAQANSISYRLTPGVAITSFAALNLTNASSLRVRLVDATYGTVYDKTADLSAVQPEPEWWSWFFGLRVAPELSVVTDLPAYPAADLLIDLVGGSSLAVGVLLMGQARQIGLGVNLGANVGIQDYSRKETNDFGDTVLIQRAFSKRASFDMLLEKSDVDITASFLTGLRAVPALYIGHKDYESTVVFGVYKDFQITISYATHSDCSLDLEGLT